MAKFVFKLDPLLKARKRTEETHQRHVAEIERQRVEFEDRLRRQQVSITQDKEAWRGSLVGSIDMHMLRRQAATAISAVRQAQQITLQLAGVHRRLDAARDKLIEATKDRRAIEMLRDRRHAEWKTRIEKAETSFLDELACSKAARAPWEDKP